MKAKLANSDELSDKALMLQVRDGKVNLLASLFDRHHVMLYNFFLKLTGDPATSEDLVQEVFLRMLKYRHTYRGESAFVLWMFRIARNSHIDHVRKLRREQPLAEESDKYISHEPLPQESIEYGQQIDILHRALSRLAIDKREVLILSRFQNLKYHEIAELLDCTVGTIKLRVHRAIKELRDIFFTLTQENAT